MPSTVDDLRYDLPGRAIRFIDDHGTVYTLDVSLLFDQPINGGKGDDLVLLDPSARVLASVHGGTLVLREAATGRRLTAPLKWSGSISAMAVSRDGGRLAYGGDETVHVVETASGRVSAEFTLAAKGDSEIEDLAFSPDGRTLAVSSALWDGGTTVELRDLERGVSRLVEGGGDALAFRPDGRLLLSGSAATVIDPVTAAGRPGDPGLGRFDGAGAFAFSPDGKQVAVSGPERIALWNGDLTTMLAEFPHEPGGEVESLAWSPDGRTLATYERGMRVRLWDVPKRQPLGVVFDGLGSPKTGEAGQLAFSPDGAKLYNASQDGTLRTHELGGERVAAAVCRRAGRTLTAAEWARHLPGIEPFGLCP
jgi:WD40 repeat protein